MVKPEADYQRYALGDIVLQSGETLYDAQLAYKTYGTLKGNNVILMPTFYTGTHQRNEPFFGPGRAIDPDQHFIVSVNLFGNGLSSSPSNAAPKNRGSRFPSVTVADNVRCQHRLLTEALHVDHLALVVGWSMAGCQTYHWGALFPQMVDALLPFCASAKTSTHNIVFLEGVKAALQADAAFNQGDYETPPEVGLKAFGRVYAGWAYSQTFFREQLFRQLGFDDYEALLLDWERDHLGWDANDLLCKLDTWQRSDISANETFHGDFTAALRATKARTILMPCSTDMYFPPEDNVLEFEHLPNAELRIFQSPWGHCAPSLPHPSAFHRFFDRAVRDLLIP